MYPYYFFGLSQRRGVRLLFIKFILPEMVESERKKGGKMPRTKFVNRVREINKKSGGKIKQTDKQTNKKPITSANHKEAKGN